MSATKHCEAQHQPCPTPHECSDSRCYYVVALKKWDSYSSQGEMPVTMEPFDILNCVAKWAGRVVLFVFVAISALWLAVILNFI